jgi:hypothetical protein
VQPDEDVQLVGDQGFVQRPADLVGGDHDRRRVVRPARGALAIAKSAQARGIRILIVPAASAREVAVGKSVEGIASAVSASQLGSC